MKRLFGILVGLVVAVNAHTNAGAGPGPDVSSINNLNAQQVMQGQGYATAGGGSSNAEGGDSSSSAVAVSGDATSDSSSGAVAVSGDATSGSSASSYSGASSSGAIISTTSISNYKNRTPPLSSVPPYLPYWTHGGWGTIKAYFSNGPSDDQVYERSFDPADSGQMKELRGVLKSLSYDGPVNALGNILGGVCAIFGGPDNFHHGRGLEIASSLVRETRPKKKPLIVFIDSNVDKKLLKEAGYAYVGKISIEGNVDRNWDHAYDAAVAEALLWDVDVLLISGGMKAVTVGSSSAFPGVSFGYSQANYSLSLSGGRSNGITEGKGKAILGAEGYRFWPQAAGKRQIPQVLYDRIHVTAAVRPEVVVPAQQQPSAPTTVTTSATSTKPTANATTATTTAVAPAAKRAAPTPTPAPTQMTSIAASKKEQHVGVEVSKELYDLAGFQQGQRIENMIIR